MKRSHWILLFGVVVIGGLLLLGPRPTEKREAVEEKAPLPDAEKIAEPNDAGWQRIRGRSAFPAEERAEAIRLANWKANFPWKPTLAKDYRFNPKQVMLRYATRPSRNYLMTTREKQLLEHGWKYRRQADKDAGRIHMSLKKFFQWEERFSKPFEEFYRILEEHGFDYDPYLIFRAFGHLWHHHYCLANEGKNVLGTDHPKGYRESLAAVLCSSEWMHLTRLSEENVPNAWKLADRLIAEVEGVLEAIPEHPNLFPDDLQWGSSDLHALMKGEEELLVPYEDWYEKHVIREAERVGDIEIRYPPGAEPERKAITVGHGDRLIDVDDNQVPYYEGMEVAIVDEKLDGEIPLRVASDGTVRLPPEEYEAILEKITPPPPPMLESPTE